MRILICGGRDFADRKLFNDTMDRIILQNRIGRVIQGGASGADALAREWCVKFFCTFEHFPADWKKHGKAAGPIRNQLMIDQGQPDLVIAFPGGRGTADLVSRARKAGIEVREVTA